MSRWLVLLCVFGSGAYAAEPTLIANPGKVLGKALGALRTGPGDPLDSLVRWRCDDPAASFEVLVTALKGTCLTPSPVESGVLLRAGEGCPARVMGRALRRDDGLDFALDVAEENRSVKTVALVRCGEAPGWSLQRTTHETSLSVSTRLSGGFDPKGAHELKATIDLRGEGQTARAEVRARWPSSAAWPVSGEVLLATGRGQLLEGTLQKDGRAQIRIDGKAAKAVSLER